MTATNQPPSSLFHLTWPLFIDLAFHFLTGALNTFMVGQVSYQSVAALAVGNQILDLCITLFNFIGIGSSVVIAQYLGAGDKAMTRRVVHTAIGFNLLVPFFFEKQAGFDGNQMLWAAVTALVCSELGARVGKWLDRREQTRVGD